MYHQVERDQSVGITEPAPFIHALLSYTAKMDRKRLEPHEMNAKERHRAIKGELKHEKMREEHLKEEDIAEPAGDYYKKIKALSLFPSIYEAPRRHRMYPAIKVDDVQGGSEVISKKMRGPVVSSF